MVAFHELGCRPPSRDIDLHLVQFSMLLSFWLLDGTFFAFLSTYAVLCGATGATQGKSSLASPLYASPLDLSKLFLCTLHPERFNFSPFYISHSILRN